MTVAVVAGKSLIFQSGLKLRQGSLLGPVTMDREPVTAFAQLRAMLVRNVMLKKRLKWKTVAVNSNYDSLFVYFVCLFVCCAAKRSRKTTHVLIETPIYSIPVISLTNCANQTKK